MKRLIKDKLKSFISKTFVLGQHFGFDLLPRHFYSEIPNIHKLRKTDWWKKEFSMIGLSSDLENQLQFINQLISNVKTEIQETNVHEIACIENKSKGFGGRIDADVLYAFIRNIKPKKIIQLGCGVSTAICINAAKREGYQPEIMCVEPYPNEFLKEQSKQGIIELIDSPVEELTVDFVSTTVIYFLSIQPIRLVQRENQVG